MREGGGSKNEGSDGERGGLREAGREAGRQEEGREGGRGSE